MTKNNAALRFSQTVWIFTYKNLFFHKIVKDSLLKKVRSFFLLWKKGVLKIRRKCLKDEILSLKNWQPSF